MNRSFCQLLLLLIPAATAAQQTYSLKDCITYGLQHHRNNIIHTNNIQLANAQTREARAGYLPAINVDGGIDNNIKVQESVIPAGLFGDKDIKVAFTKQFNTNAAIQLDQTIYDQSLISGMKANRYNKEQASLNKQQSDETIIYNISTAYYQIQVYRQQLTYLGENLANYRQQINIAQLQVDKGVTLQTDLNKVTVNYNNTLSQVSVAESNLALAFNQLKNEMGYDLNKSIIVDSTVNNNNGGTAEQTPFTVTNRTDYQLDIVNAKLLEIDQRRIRATGLPKLSAYAKYGGLGFGDNLSESFRGMSSFSSVGIRLSIPILDGLKRNAQYDQARYKYHNALEQVKLHEDKFRLEFENNRTKLIKAQSTLDNDRRNVSLAQSVFTTVDLQLQKGATSLTDWLNAQYSLKEAQNNLLNALYNTYLSRIDLEKANGTLKTYYSQLPH
ncbi:TolC family protein [Chitinophaga pendula]|uniref:TolC family protein n=1 Tax=Chitinophaga TaxID=79328 RepID=UPI000BAFDDEA|nr:MULTISPECIES: TolC family protein [Chitinophaga]ASZ13017.1 transporter [Chitinophaga sp. MD30]UCJ09352.1 TolC family protein [Chitinophaga pendula]